MSERKKERDTGKETGMGKRYMKLGESETQRNSFLKMTCSNKGEKIAEREVIELEREREK